MSTNCYDNYKIVTDYYCNFVLIVLLFLFRKDLALFDDFTMLETMYYFGTLYGMSPKKVRKRGQFLLELLELPSARKTIKSLR